MEKKEIKKYIDDAVTTFKNMLENTYLKDNTPFYGIGYEPLTQHFTGKISFSRKKNGNFRICGELPKVMLKDDVKGLPRGFKDWKIFPIVIRLFNVSEDSFKKKEKSD